MRPIAFPDSPAWRLFAWSVLCLLSRYLYLHFFLVSSWTPEEALRGTVALEFYNALHGSPLRLPFWCHQADQYLGGSLVTSALTALSYHLFGIRLIALKASALLFTLAGLWLAYRWHLKEHGRRVADTFALLYCLATPHFIALGEVAMGYHTESVAFVGWMLCAAAAAARDPASALARFSFGLAAGLGFWFSNINALATLAILAAYPALVRPRQLLALCAGAFVGLAPWIAFNAANEFGSVAQLLESFSSSSFAAKRNYGGSWLLKVWLMVARDLPLSYGLGKAGYAYFALIGAVLVLPFSGWRGPVQRLLLAYAALFLVAYGCSNFYLGVRSSDSVHYRYLHQFAFLTYAALALALERFVWRKTALSCLIGFAAYGAFLQDGSMPPGRVWAYRPQSYEALSAKVMNSCYAPVERFPDLLRWMHSFPGREAVFAQIPFEGAYNFAPLVARKETSEWPLANPYFAEGLGEYYGEKSRIIGRCWRPVRFSRASRE